jgi:hypothetical protein
MLEKKIEEAVYTYAVSKGMLHYKFTSPNRRSVPDQLFIKPDGNVFFIEFKRTGETATPPQQREHARLRENNVNVYVCDDIAQGKKIIDDELWLSKLLEDQLT